MTPSELSRWWWEEFKACGCGAPEDVANLVRDVLDAVREFHEPGDFLIKHPPFKARMDELLPDGGLRYFVLYRLSDLELLEHGSSLPGWLTRKGEQILEAMKRHPFEEWDDLDYGDAAETDPA